MSVPLTPDDVDNPLSAAVVELRETRNALRGLEDRHGNRVAAKHAVEHLDAAMLLLHTHAFNLMYSGQYILDMLHQSYHSQEED